MTRYDVITNHTNLDIKSWQRKFLAHGSLIDTNICTRDYILALHVRLVGYYMSIWSSMGTDYVVHMHQFTIWNYYQSKSRFMSRTWHGALNYCLLYRGPFWALRIYMTVLSRGEKVSIVFLPLFTFVYIAQVFVIVFFSNEFTMN